MIDPGVRAPTDLDRHAPSTGNPAIPSAICDNHQTWLGSPHLWLRLLEEHVSLWAAVAPGSDGKEPAPGIEVIQCYVWVRCPGNNDKEPA